MTPLTGKTYGVGLVGAGAIYPAHLAAYGSLAPRFRPVGVAEIDERRLGELEQEHSFVVLTRDYRELLERTDIDIVDVCTPPSSHAAIVRDALQAGKYVICEKPLATTLEQIDLLTELALAYPGRLSTVFQRRYHPVIRDLLQARETGSFGRLLGGRFTRYTKGELARRCPWWGSWSVAGGGTVMTQFIHELDLMRLLFGPPSSVHAFVDTLRLDIESDDTFSATIRFACGALVACNSAIGVRESEVSFEVAGTDRLFRYSSLERAAKGGGMALARDMAQKVIRHAQSRLGGYAKQPAAAIQKAGMHGRYFDAVLSSLDTHHPLPVGPEEARGAVELAVAIYTSGISGETVGLPLTDSSPYYRGVTVAAYQARSSLRVAT